MTGEDGERGPDGDLDGITSLVTATDHRSDETTHVYHLDPGESPCTGVVSAVAAVDGQDPMAMAPLYGAVDTDALDRLVDSRSLGLGVGGVRITFEYLGYTVTVDGSGRVVVSG